MFMCSNDDGMNRKWVRPGRASFRENEETITVLQPGIVLVFQVKNRNG